MTSYPLPGETVERTIRNCEFGFGHYSADEPAPDHIAVLLRVLLKRWRLKELARTTWERRNDWASYNAWTRATEDYAQADTDLMRAMNRYMYRTLVSDGYRLRLAIEPEGCRRRWVEIQPVEER